MNKYQPKKMNVAIIGAGIAGLSCARQIIAGLCLIKVSMMLLIDNFFPYKIN
jgi:ribulose 1,5-bisphosphate synthetase/thiazole synthase